jgi:hypothetical protein
VIVCRFFIETPSLRRVPCDALFGTTASLSLPLSAPGQDWVKGPLTLERPPRLGSADADGRSLQRHPGEVDDLATYRRQDGQLMFGVYADVERAGAVGVGDPVAVLED